ncbi:RING/U-box superfamily protein [Artemisia annua]|uniref:RING/U-box superfamily protein n=1 Tax=Artemisia annua TaxID=35608 RepID=A0A2U1Q733_ARTAN|nr:RING/U-box superfamily protein [Artemisia annua]
MGHQGCNFRPLILVERKRFQNSFTFALFGEKRTTGTMLFRSRWALSYSYHFAFYMFGHKVFNDEMTKEDLEIKQHLFEEQQQHLTTNVEKLSKFIEEPFDSFTQDKIMEIRMQVINLYVITDSLCNKMYECIDTGLLGSLQFGNITLAPYHSKGIEKATELPLRDFIWVTNGLYRLFRSRWTLSYSYHFAFYMFGHKVFNDEMTKEDLEIKQHLFEEQQQHLTTNVEKLSKFIEEPFDSFTQDKIMEIRMQVINLYVITDICFFAVSHLEDRPVAVDKPAVELEYRNCYATGCEYHRDERWNYSKLCAQDTIDYTKLRSCLIEVRVIVAQQVNWAADLGQIRIRINFSMPKYKRLFSFAFLKAKEVDKVEEVVDYQVQLQLQQIHPHLLRNPNEHLLNGISPTCIRGAF